MAQLVADDEWVPDGMTAIGQMAFGWKKDATHDDCDAYQDGCYVALIYSRWGCPGGFYIEVSVRDSDDVVVGRANEITAGLGEGDTAKVALEMPGGNPLGGKAKLSELRCMT